MHIQEVTPPASTALLLGEVKQHLRIDDTGEDAHLGALIAAATGMIEAACGLALISRTVDVFIDHWPAGSVRRIDVPLRPLGAVNAVYAISTDSTETVLPESTYTVHTGLHPAITFKHSISWPFSHLDSEGGYTPRIRLRIEAGFGDNWNALPAGIQQALLQLITTLYFNRGDTKGHDQSASGPLKHSGALSLLAPYRQVRL